MLIEHKRYLPLDLIIKAMNQYASYQTAAHSQSRKEVRSYSAGGVDVTWLCDLGIKVLILIWLFKRLTFLVGFMEAWKKLNSFLITIDVASRYTAVACLRGKSSPIVRKGFEKIFEDLQTKPYNLVGDSGSEFLGNLEYFQNVGIYFRPTSTRGKAALVENQVDLAAFFLNVE